MASDVRRFVPSGGTRSQIDRCGKMEPLPSMTWIVGADVRQVRLGPARMDDHVAAQVVGRVALPGYRRPYAGRQGVDGVQRPCRTR